MSFHICPLLVERGLDAATVIALPLVLLLLWWLPPGFAALAVFACLYGTVNGIMTIVRGVAVPEMLTPQAYGTINGIIAGPGAMLEALAPVGAALLWSATGSYDAVLAGAIGAGVIVALAFGFAAVGSTRAAAA